MIDSQTRREIWVTTDETGGPYIMLQVDRLSRVRQLLDEHRIPYWVEAHAISLDGHPAVAFINLGRSGDPIKVQEILDSAA